jgi:GAF domain-containing protein
MGAAMLSAASAAPGPPRVSLAEAGARTAAPEYRPLHVGRKVTVRGVVNSRAFHFPGYSLIAIEDGDRGAVIQATGKQIDLDKLQPGDDIEVQGTIADLSGMVVIVPDAYAPMGHKAAPRAYDVPLTELNSPRHLGRLVRAEGKVKAADAEGAGLGFYITLDAADYGYKIFLPSADSHSLRLTGYQQGDTVRATGVAYQFCRQLPYNRSYQLLAHDASAISRIEPPLVSALSLVIALGAILFVSFFLWSRERRLRVQRKMLRKTYELGEQILGCPSPQAVLKNIRGALPLILGVTRARLYIYNRAAKTLDEIADEPADSRSISLATPPGGTQAGAVACFHYRTLLVIPDIERSPFPIAEEEGVRRPRALLFVPMVAQGEIAGVLELDQDDRVRDFSTNEQELAQHLGNQIGVALRLLDQRSVQEQLFRTEKLAAVGRLITGIVNELQNPLSSITDLARRALEKSYAGPAEREVAAIASEAQKAGAMVARLVSFAAAEQVEARPVSVSTLLRNLIEFRERDWKASGIRVRNLTSREPLQVLGSHGQLEQVFLNLLVHAELCLADAPQKQITVRTSLLAKRLLIEIGYSAPPGSGKPQETASVLGVSRSVIAGHGGEVRLIEKPNTEPRFEIELPVAARERTTSITAAPAGAPVREFSKHMTALVVEPEESAQRQLLGILAARGIRVVPVNNTDTALELANRMRFDAAFCSIRAPGLNWVEASERMTSRVGGFILLSEGYNAELANDFEGEGRYVLAKPVQEAELDRVLRKLEPAQPAATVRNGVA